MLFTIRKSIETVEGEKYGFRPIPNGRAEIGSGCLFELIERRYRSVDIMSAGQMEATDLIRLNRYRRVSVKSLFHTNAELPTVGGRKSGRRSIDGWRYAGEWVSKRTAL